MRKLFVGVLLLALVSCSGEEQGSEAKTILLDLDKVESYSIENDAASYKIVELDGSEEALIGNVSDLQIYNDTVVISTGDKIKIFTLEGDFIASIERKGRSQE